MLITGGAGFIGCNTAQRFIQDGHQVIIIDDLSRRGSNINLKWLHRQGSLEFHQLDIADYQSLEPALKRYDRLDAIIHLAAQPAVTTSLDNPRRDFLTNALGTFNMLEITRQRYAEAIFIYSSTNKVYGALEGLCLQEGDKRYQAPGLPAGVAESAQLDFHSPYGCSKGAGDQYVRDYHRIFNLRTVVFRQSCIYGYRQFGVEDQGWVAWFAIAALLGKPITLYGNGKQVRDILFIDDLVELYIMAIERIDRISGEIFNIGGGAENALSLIEFLELLEAKVGTKLKLGYQGWRPGDQPLFISDNSKANDAIGWKPRTNYSKGIEKLIRWIKENLNTIRGFYE